MTQTNYTNINYTNPIPTPSITVTTDKTYYVAGDTITISGTADPHLTVKVQLQGIPNPIYKKIPVSIAILDSANNPVSIQQIDVDDNGKFTTVVRSDGVLWKYPGLYTVIVQQGTADHKVTTKFWFNYNGGAIPAEPIPTPTPTPTPVPQPTQNNTGTPQTTSGDCPPDCLPKATYNPLTASGPILPISVTTDKSTYDHNSIIMVSGHVDHPYPGQDIGMKIISPSGNVVSSAQLSVDRNGDYTTNLNTANPLWTENGVYTIYVQKGDEQASVNSTVFQLTGESPPPSTTPSTSSTPTIPTTIFNATSQDLASINDARNNQTIAAEVNVVNQTVQTTSINSNVSVQTNNTSPDSLSISVSAPSQTSPKVIVVNIAATTIDIANLKDLGVMYDGVPIPPASNIDSILHAKSTDSPSFAIVITQSGAQILILIPHFSTHTITITNMSKVIPAVPEFPFTLLTLIIATFSIVLIPKIFMLNNNL
jgi:hypothetical protein